jgi:hypothetical protein
MAGAAVTVTHAAGGDTPTAGVDAAASPWVSAATDADVGITVVAASVVDLASAGAAWRSAGMAADVGTASVVDLGSAVVGWPSVAMGADVDTVITVVGMECVAGVDSAVVGPRSADTVATDTAAGDTAGKVGVVVRGRRAVLPVEARATGAVQKAIAPAQAEARPGRTRGEAKVGPAPVATSGGLKVLRAVPAPVASVALARAVLAALARGGRKVGLAPVVTNGGLKVLRAVPAPVASVAPRGVLAAQPVRAVVVVGPAPAVPRRIATPASSSAWTDSPVSWKSSAASCASNGE